MFLDHPQKGFLGRKRQLADFIQKEGPPSACFTRPLRLLLALVYAPSTCPKRVLSTRVGGRGGTVHHHEFAFAAMAVAMDEIGKHLFARTGLAGDQHRCVAEGALKNEFQAIVDFGAAADHTPAIDDSLLFAGMLFFR